MALDIKRFIGRFVDEARDHLRRLEEGLSALAGNPSDKETLNAIFRSAHTIKGSSRMMKLTAINETTHRLEDLLGALRDGSLAYTEDLGSLLRRGIDAIAADVDRLAGGGEVAPTDQALCADLARAVSQEVRSTPEEPSPDLLPLEGEKEKGKEWGKSALRSPDTVRVRLDKLDELIKLMGEVVSSHARMRQRLVDIRRIERSRPFGNAPAATHLRDFVRDFRDDVQSQDLLMEELHDKALVMRMLPLSIVFDSAPRMVRDLARATRREVACVTSGMDIELDRHLIDRLGDPVVHLLRNAVDHGIEDPAERLKVGKSRQGHIRLTARQDGGVVVIEVSDDGAGLPVAAIRDKAVRKGLVTAEQAAALPEAEMIDFIFLPGFSTTAIITDVSGRGVGMDVVRRCVVDELQGSIKVETRPGAGTTFSLRLPTSLAVMRVLMVEAGGQTLGFTAQHVTQLLRLPADRLLTVAERQAVVIHNEFVPVVPLADLLALPPAQRSDGDDLLLVVVRRASEKLALLVDDLIDERDMVIKPLPEHLRHITTVSGMVMTGRNTLVNVLHAPILIDAARRARTGGPRPADAAARDKLRILIVDDSLNTREIEKDVLEAHGYQVTLAEDGVDGLLKARGEAFDAILTDVEMPNMDGFTLTASLRQEERYRDTPIIIITSRAREEDKRRGVQVGADAYIVKGDFDQSGLLDTLRGLLG
ncbi:MAG: hybrid sensor histidine kinase/response regulator [Alphaproteobacteria bacterium]